MLYIATCAGYCVLMVLFNFSKRHIFIIQKLFNLDYDTTEEIVSLHLAYGAMTWIRFTFSDTDPVYCIH